MVDVPPFPSPVPFAHRGGHHRGLPENSLQAFRTAMAGGAMIESDVRLSLDRVPVLVHDAISVRRGLPTIPAITPAFVLSWLRVPRLAELLAMTGPDEHVCLDLKVLRAWPALVRVAREAAASRRVWIVHDDLDVLAEIRRHDPDIRLVHEARPHVLAAGGETLEEHPARLAALGIDAQNTRAGAWTPELVANAHRHGILAFGSLLADAEPMRRAAAIGLDAIFSDHVDDLVTALGSIKDRSRGEVDLGSDDRTDADRADEGQV